MAAEGGEGRALARPVFAKYSVFPAIPDEGVQVAVAVQVGEGGAGIVPHVGQAEGVALEAAKAGALAVPVFPKYTVLPSVGPR